MKKIVHMKLGVYIDLAITIANISPRLDIISFLCFQLLQQERCNCEKTAVKNKYLHLWDFVQKNNSLYLILYK